MGTRTRSSTPRNIGAPDPGNLLETMVAHLNKIGCAILADPGLRIDGGSGSAVAEAELAFYALVAETLVAVSAGQNMPALAGTVDNGDFGIFVWEIDSSGTITQLTLATGASLAAITMPTLSDDRAVVGALIVNPDGTGDFVGGTTDIDDATVSPNPVFLDGHNFGALTNRITFRETGAPAST